MKLGAYAIEQDYSHYVQNASDIILAVVGTATNGPINEPTVCTGISDLMNKFGNQSPNCFGIYASQYFLRQASKMYYVRVANDKAVGSTVTVRGKTTAGDIDALVLTTIYAGTALDGYTVQISNVRESEDTVLFDLVLRNDKGNVLESIRDIKLDSLYDVVDTTAVIHEDALASRYIRVSSIHESIWDGSHTGSKAEIIIPDTYVLSGGNDGIDGLTSGDYINAVSTLATDQVDMNLLVIPGVSDPAVIVSALSMVEARGDTLYIVDTPNRLTPDQVADWHNGEGDYSDHAKFNSSYGALYWSWQRIYDNVNNLYVEVPPSVVVPAVFARSKKVSEIWYAPAGLNRGVVQGVLNSVVSPDMNTVEYLYCDGNNINCIINDHQVGLCVFGQKTLSRLDTALDRVNVRMLLNYLKRIIVAACRTLTFEPNDRVTWNIFHDRIEPTLKNIKNHRGLYEYEIVKGETIVTNEDIDNYRMPCMILIKPTKAVESIPIYFTITSTGADFSSTLEANGIVS